MKCIKRTVFIMGFFSTAFIYSVVGQHSKNISLDESIQLTLQNSKQLKLNKAKVDEANAVLEQARNKRLPDIGASGSYLRMHAPNVDAKLGGQSANALSSIKVNQVAYAIGSASLPLFSGFNVHYGVESAKYLAEAIRLEAANDREAQIQNAISAYSNLYKAKAQVGLITENLKEAQKRVEDFVNMRKNGTVVHNDLLKAQLKELNTELSLFEAQKDLKMALVNMNMMLGLPEDLELLPDTNWLEPIYDTRTITDWEQAAIDNRKDMKALGLREKSASFNIKAAKSDYFPGIALTGNYIAADIPNLLTVTNALGIGLGVKYSLSSLWKTGAKVAQAKAKQQQSLMNKHLLEDQLRIQINEAHQEYLLSLKKIEVYRKSIEQVQENYTVIQSELANKVVTTTDLLDADIQQLQARLNYVFARADAVVAYKKLLQATGLLNITNSP